MIGGIQKIARCDYIGASQRISLILKIDLKLFFYFRGYSPWQNMIIW